MNTSPQTNAQPNNWENLTEDQQDTWMRENATPQTSHSPLPKGAPTWRNDGQDEARAQAFIEGKNFAVAHAQRLADALKKLTERAGMGFCHDATHDGLLNCEAIAKAREALAQWEGVKS